MTDGLNDTTAESEHKELVIANAEFCMMNFYKLQWDSQRKRTLDAMDKIEQQAHEIKRLKRNYEHQISVTTRLQSDIQDAQFDNDTLRGHINSMREAMTDLAQGEYLANKKCATLDQHNLNILSIVGQIFEENEDIKNKYINQIQQELTSTSRDLGLPTLSTSETLDYDSEATIPDTIA